MSDRNDERLCAQRPAGWTAEAACALPMGHNSKHRNAAGDLTWELAYVADMRRELEEGPHMWIVALRAVLEDIGPMLHSEGIDGARDELARWERQQATTRGAATMSERVRHGRHCTCSACAREDWTRSALAPCGMHGPRCPARYQPLGRAGEVVGQPDREAEVERLRKALQVAADAWEGSLSLTARERQAFATVRAALGREGEAGK